ncbi:hypothetical protein QU487_00345 [Crenobacter sp. SG2305]|nr:hypothetical protein [Crenobacter sp. SG2305]MDN0081207.1 hypothetical protein [Crenobacter sp. SG2305]
MRAPLAWSKTAALGKAEVLPDLMGKHVLLTTMTVQGSETSFYETFEF